MHAILLFPSNFEMRLQQALMLVHVALAIRMHNV